MKTDNMYAFPGRQPSFIGNQEMEVPTPGLTKREYFAAMAMQAMVAGEGARIVANRDGRYNETNWKEVVALNAIEFADELLKQLENEAEI